MSRAQPAAGPTHRAPAPQAAESVQRERRTRAVWLSLLVCPGLGQLVLGRPVQGVAVLLASAGGVVLLAARLWRAWHAALPPAGSDWLAGAEAVLAALRREQLALALTLAWLALWGTWSALDAWRRRPSA